MRTWHTLIDVAGLSARLDDPLLRIFDCRHDLGRPEHGRNAYAAGHIPHARFLHLDEALSGEKTGRNGRHPLPDPDVFAATLRAQGVGPATQIVAYDDAGGMFAARLWWMMRWLGHDAVAVLDGGFPAWQAAQRPVSTEPAGLTAAGRFAAHPRLNTVTADWLLDRLDDPALCIVDARAADRFRGENETLDPVGGHIPGAINRPFRDNLCADDRFKPADRLRAEWSALLGTHLPSGMVAQCGSGVTACHNLLALEICGLSGARLYPGSWSEWCSDPARPVARGD